MKIRREVTIQVEHPITLGTLREVLEDEHVSELPDHWLFDYPDHSTFRIIERDENEHVVIDGGVVAALSLGSTIEELDLSVKAYNLLKRMNVGTVADLVRLSPNDCMDQRNFGLNSVKEIEEKLARHGFNLAADPV